MMAISAAGDAYSNYQAQKAQAEYAEGIYNINAKFAELEAEDSIVRGEVAAGEVMRRANQNISLVRQKGKQIAGTQRASFAAQGLDTGGDTSAANILADTESLNAQDVNEVDRAAKLDVITIKNNAFREAWGFKNQAQVYGTQARIAMSAGNAAARNTLIGGGVKTLGYGLDSYSKYKTARKAA